MKKIAYVCPTYRDPKKPSLSRLFGLVTLLEQLQAQNTEHDVKLAIIDSSPTSHPFFETLGEESDEVVYLHLPDRNEVCTSIETKYPLSASFIPSDSDYDSEHWKKILEETLAWSQFIPWRKHSAIQEAILKAPFNKRPTIGTKRNVGISAIMERFGQPDIIAYADDDDHHSPNYSDLIVRGIEGYDFGRMSHYLTYAHKSNEGNPIWGEYDVPFIQDINGVWRPSDDVAPVKLINNESKERHPTRTVGEKFFPLLCLSFSPLSFEGALHTMTFNHWQRTVDTFGGALPLNFGEDLVYYWRAKEEFGRDFKTTNIQSNPASFLRTTDGTNASLVEWTHTREETDIPIWAKDALIPLQFGLAAQSIDIPTKFKEMGNHYKNTGEINWRIMGLDV